MPLTHIDLSTFCFKIYLSQENNPKVTVRAKLALAARPGPLQSIWKWSSRRDHRVLKVQDWGEDETGEDPLIRWFEGPPQRIFWILSTFMCVFNAFFVKLMSLELWTRFQSFWSQTFARKDIPWRARNWILDKIFFRQPRFCMLLWHYFTYMSRQALLLALSWLGGTSKTNIFKKIYKM